MTTFADLGLSPRLLAALPAAGYETPTPIQQQAIPHVVQGRDLMGLAQTGTGKTAAFGLPLLTRLLEITSPPGPRHVRSLILAPTRELVQQIYEHIFAFTKGTPVKVTMVVGGASIHRQSERLAKGSDVLIATPGRLIDLLERGAVSLERCGYLVLDEADHMLDMGFIHALRTIAKHLPHKRQTLLFSATMPKDIEEIATAYLRDPVRVQVNPPGKPAEKITQGVHFTPQGDKAKLLESYLQKHPGEAAIVFSRTKHGADKIAKLLVSWGFGAVAIHGNRSQNQRERALADFREGQAMVLVATDVAARGIDIPIVRHVYNYDMPNVPENYVHRIGRTARAGADGASVSFCAPAEMGELRAIENVLKKPVPVIGGAPWANDVAAAAKPGPRGGARGGARGSAAGGARGGAHGGGAQRQGGARTDAHSAPGRPAQAKPAAAKPAGAKPAPRAGQKPGYGGQGAPRRGAQGGAGGGQQGPRGARTPR